MKSGSLEAPIWASHLWQVGLAGPDVSRPQTERSHSPSLPFLPKSSFSASEARCCPGKSSACKEIELALTALPELLISGHEGAAAELPFSMWV